MDDVIEAYNVIRIIIIIGAYSRMLKMGPRQKYIKTYSSVLNLFTESEMIHSLLWLVVDTTHPMSPLLLLFLSFDLQSRKSAEMYAN